MANTRDEFIKNENTKADVEREKEVQLEAGAKKCWIEEDPDKWILCCEWEDL